MSRRKKPQKPQPEPGGNELPDFCTHVACAHDEPEKRTDLRDNVDMLLTHIMALFEALREEDIVLAGLGADLYSELGRRIDLMYYSHRYFK